MYTRFRKALDKKNDKGFTLIELLVVIIIIGILAAIAIPIFLSQRKKAFEASEKSDARSVAIQMETYYTDNQAYPPTGVVVASATGPARVNFLTGVAGTVTDYVSLSPGNSVKVYETTASPLANGGYCIAVANTNTGKVAVYDSLAGGLQPATVTACPTGETLIL